MRFIALLLTTLALTTQSVSSQFASRICTDAPGTCTSCVGETNCCDDKTNVEYGHCDVGGSAAFNCPDGSKFTCNGGACNNLGLTCNYEADTCDSKDHFCWGTITCDGPCPEGYATGDFCHQDGNSGQFKVCGATAPEEPTTQPPTEPPTEAPTNPPTEAPTDAPTNPPTEAPTNPPTDAPTDAPTNPPTEAPTDAPTDAPTGPAITQAPEVTDAPTQAPTTAAPTTVAPTSPPSTQENVVCYQEIVGSLTGSYAQVSADLDDWKQRMYTALGLTGDIDLQVGYAQVTDRVSFENGCEGPYTTVADIFVHIQTTQADYDTVAAQLEAFIAANPLTAYASIDCMARSIVTELPTCGKVPTTPTGGAGPNPGGEVPTPDNVVCYQEVVGSLTGSYASISADLDMWQQNLYTFLGLTGPLNLQMGHAQIPDRVSFENGCDGPYANMADLFVHIKTTAAEYDAVSAKLEAFIAANPLTAYASIDCMARSVVTYLPTCGKLEESTPTGPSTPQPDDKSVLCFQEVVGTLTGSYAQVSAQLDAWEQKLYAELGLSGPLNLNMGHAQIPDRVSFENGCVGPYSAMADIFVYIPTTFGEYDALAARLETFIANNPFNTGVIACSARSVVSELPYCGKIMNPGTPAPPTSMPGGAGQQGQTCPAVAFTTSASTTGVDVAITTPGVTITFMDVHITTATGFYNFRMSASSATAFTYTFPAYLSIDGGQSISYWFTTASTSAAYPTEFACDSASFSYTAPGAPSTAPAVPAPATPACPSVAFDHTFVNTGMGANAGLYMITFAAATPTSTVDWVDVHVTANGGRFNYRMDAAATGFVQALPSPHLELAVGTSVQYSFTYQANGVACDTAMYTVTATLAA